jgi:hypothetical protein
MADNEFVKKVEEKIKGAAKAVEDFADEVAAPEVPPVLIPNPDTPTTKPANDGNKDGKVS